MTPRMRTVGVLTAVLLGIVAGEAAAWGPRAQRAITITAIQMIRRTHASAFKTKNNNYEEDILRGAEAGPEVLAVTAPLTNEKEAIAAVATEIQLLRAVHAYGLGSYFAFRMGVLGSLVSNLILPYGMAWSPNELQLRARIRADIDAALDEYHFTASRQERQYIRDVREYFELSRQFLDDNRRMITDDYTRGRGYNGYLREGGQAYFGRAIEAVADVWHTVLRLEGDNSDIPPSPPVIARYFVDEIGYLLNEKKNLHQANRTYENFVSVNPGTMDFYEQIGNLYYAYGTEDARERGVREWRIAYSQSGPARRRVGGKLSQHYLRVGEEFLAAGSRPGASERDLPNALDAFTQALEFDRTNDVAAQRLNETNVAIVRREERRRLAVNIIATGEKVVKEAEKYRLSRDFANAIATYKHAISLFETIDDEFPEQSNTAKASIKANTKNINDVIIEVLDAAAEAISAGDDAVSERRWGDAYAAYESVPEIVKIIPTDDPTHARHTKDVLDEVERKITDAKATEQRVKEAQARQADAAQQAGGSKKP